MELIQSFLLSVTRVKLSIYEQRIITRIVEHGQQQLQGISYSQLKYIENPYGNETVTVTIRDILTEGTKDYEKVIKACKALMNRTFEFWDPDRKVYYTDTVIHNVIHVEGSGQVSFMVSRVFFEVMYNFTKGYKNYDLENALTLPTPTAVRLYVLMNNQTRPLQWTIEQLKNMFGVSDKYKQTADFIKKVIEPARKAICDNHCNGFTYSRVYEGNKVKAITFFPLKTREEERTDTPKEELAVITAVKMYLQEYCGFTSQEVKNNDTTIRRFSAVTGCLDTLNIIEHRARKKNGGKAYIIGAMKGVIKEQG